MRQTGTDQTFSSHLFAPLVLLGCLVPLISYAEVNTFEAGQPIRASEMNHNFKFIQEQINGISSDGVSEAGCTVEQVDSSAKITCADGSTAVVPGYGTVLVYPEGEIGEVPDLTYNTGEIVIKDAGGNLLGVASGIGGTDISIELTSNKYPVAGLLNKDSSKEVLISSGLRVYVFFLDEACGGIPFATYEFYLIDLAGSFYIPNTAVDRESLLFKSKRVPAGFAGADYDEARPCVSGQFVEKAMPTIPYTLAPELTSAVYPVRLEQLP